MKFSDHKNKLVVFFSLTVFLLVVISTKDLLLKSIGLSDVLGSKPNPLAVADYSDVNSSHSYPLLSQADTITGSVQPTPMTQPGPSPTSPSPQTPPVSPKQSLSITPSQVNGMLATSYIFTSEINTPTGPIPVQSDWSVMVDQPGSSALPQSVLLDDCDGHFTCKVHSGVIPQNITVTAKYQNSGALAHLNIANQYPASPFSDNIPDWAKLSIDYLYELGVTKGYNNGTFGSSDPVTRGQVVVMLNNLMAKYGIKTDTFLQGKKCNIFSDVPATHYAYKALCAANYMGWLQSINTPQNTFSPDQPMKRGEVAQVINNVISDKAFNAVFNIPNQFVPVLSQQLATILASADFYDISFSTPNAKAIGVVGELSIMSGNYQSGKGVFFRPNDSINRAEMAQTIINVVKLLQQN